MVARDVTERHRAVAVLQAEAASALLVGQPATSTDSLPDSTGMMPQRSTVTEIISAPTSAPASDPRQSGPPKEPGDPSAPTRATLSDEPASPVAAFPKPRMGPALIVVGIAVLIVGSGATLALVGSPKHAVAGAPLGTLQGQHLGASSAAPILRRITQAGQPPRDVTAAVVVPAASTVTTVTTSSGIGLYSASVTLSVPAGSKSVISFYRAELAHDGWSGVSVDAAVTGPGTEVLAKRPASDGFYWGIGVDVKPSAPSLSPALAGSSAATPTSTVSLTLYEIDDPS